MIHWWSLVYSFFTCAANHGSPLRGGRHQRKNMRKRRPQSRTLQSLLLMCMAWALFALSCLEYWGWGNSSAWGVCELSTSQHACSPTAQSTRAIHCKMLGYSTPWHKASAGRRRSVYFLSTWLGILFVMQWPFVWDYGWLGWHGSFLEERPCSWSKLFFKPSRLFEGQSPRHALQRVLIKGHITSVILCIASPCTPWLHARSTLAWSIAVFYYWKSIVLELQQ